MPILADPDVFTTLIDVMCDRVKKFTFDRVLGIESRGFLLGPLIAQKLRLPFCPLRKKGKLPGKLYSIEYELEYGKDVMEVQKEAVPANSKCLVVDDLAATGGTLNAAKRLIEKTGSELAAIIVVIELKSLDARKKLGNSPMESLFSY